MVQLESNFYMNDEYYESYDANYGSNNFYVSNNMNNYDVRHNNFYDDDWEYNDGYFGEFENENSPDYDYTNDNADIYNELFHLEQRATISDIALAIKTFISSIKLRHILPILLLYLCIPLKNYHTTTIKPSIILINDSFEIFGRKTSKSKDFTTDKIEEENNLRPVVFGTVSCNI